MLSLSKHGVEFFSSLLKRSGRPTPGWFAASNQRLVEGSFLRHADPRTKLALSLAASAAVMLPLPQLAAVTTCYFLLMIGAGTTAHALRYLRRIRVALVILFAADWWFIGTEFAVLITLRLALLVTAFSLFVATTTPDELQRALDCMGLPARLSFALATAYRSLGLLAAEWRGILEAQQARGITPPQPHWRAWRNNLTCAAALLVPAVVLATQRAWSITEAAAARGVDSPLRRPTHAFRLGWVDHALLTAVAALLLSLAACH